VERASELSAFNAAALRAADPDYILVMDPRIDGYDFRSSTEALHIQPFDVVRLREGMEKGETWRWLFRETPTIVSDEESAEGVFDIDRSGVRWGRAARVGFPHPSTEFERIRDVGTPTPVERSSWLLSSPTQDSVWAFYGPRTEIVLASEFWTARALGVRVAWRSVNDFQSEQLPALFARAARVYLRPIRKRVQSAAREAAAKWATEERPVQAWPWDFGESLAESTAPVFAQQIIPVFPHGGRLRFPTPPPPVVPKLATSIPGIAVHRVLSPDADDPDGVVLSRDPESRALVQPGAPGRRITRTGYAERTDIAQPALIDLPLVHYEAAVAAPLRAAGYAASHSDKGRFHQRTLQLSQGLLFLAWTLRQQQSSRLLDLFFERPSGEPVTYRRAVRFEDLQECVYQETRAGRARLRPERRQSADSWLRAWTTQMLGRELMQAGYLLDCGHCALRTWYRSQVVTQTFRCDRCDAVNVVPASTTRSFKLNEAFFAFRQQGGHAVTFALAKLRHRATHSFLYYPESNVVRGGASREIDAAALLDGRLALVEAKTNNTVSKREVDFYCGLARRTRAQRLIFATLARDRPECGTSRCPCLATGNRDHAWDDGSRVRIAGARTDLVS
jgi:hypothetical protein